MTRLMNPFQQPAQQPAFFEPQPLAPPMQVPAPPPMGQGFPSPQAPMPDPLDSALQVLEQFEQPQQPMMQPAAPSMLPPEAGSQILDQALDVVRQIEQGEVERRRETRLAKENWLKSLTPEQKSQMQAEAQQTIDYMKIEQYIKDRKAGSDPWKTDMFGRPRQHDPFSRWFRKMPFVGAVAGGADDLSIVGSFKRLQKGQATKRDLEAIGDFRLELEYLEQRGLGDKILDMASELPGFAVEFLATSGAYSGAKAGTKMALGKGIRQVAQKGFKEALERQMLRAARGEISEATAKRLSRDVYRHIADREFKKQFAEKPLRRFAGEALSRAAGVAAQSAANPQMIFRQTARNILEDTISGEEKGIASAVGRGMLDTMIEMTSERSGKLISQSKAAQFLKRKLISESLRKGISKSRISRIIKNSGYDGLIEEIFEERLADMARAATGLEKFEWPDRDQWIAELVVFSIPTMGTAAAGYSQGKARELRKKFMEKTRDIRATSRQSERETILGDLDTYARAWAENPELVEKLKQMEGKAPSRPQWQELDMPQARFSQEERKQIAEAILKQAEISDIVELGDADLMEETPEGVMPRELTDADLMEETPEAFTPEEIGDEFIPLPEQAEEAPPAEQKPQTPAAPASSWNEKQLTDWLDNTIERRPTGKVGNSPEATADWISKGFPSTAQQIEDLEGRVRQWFEGKGLAQPAAVEEPPPPQATPEVAPAPTTSIQDPQTGEWIPLGQGRQEEQEATPEVAPAEQPPIEQPKKKPGKPKQPSVPAPLVEQPPTETKTSTFYREKREKNQRQAAEKKYFSQAKKRGAKQFKGKKTQVKNYEGQMVDAELLPGGKLAIWHDVEYDQATNKKTSDRWVLLHVPTKREVETAGSRPQLQAFAQIAEDLGMSWDFKKADKIPGEMVKIGRLARRLWEGGSLHDVDQETISKLLGTVERPPGPAADMVVDFDTLGDQNKDAVARLREIASDIPEFGYNPVFVVRGGKLTYKDGYELKLQPEQFLIDSSELQEGMTVGVNLADLEIPTVSNPIDVVKKVLANQGYQTRKSAARKSPGVTVTVGGQKYKIKVEGESITPTGNETIDRVLRQIRFTQPAQAAETKAEAKEEAEPEVSNVVRGALDKLKGRRKRTRKPPEGHGYAPPDKPAKRKPLLKAQLLPQAEAQPEKPPVRQTAAEMLADLQEELARDLEGRPDFERVGQRKPLGKGRTYADLAELEEADIPTGVPMEMRGYVTGAALEMAEHEQREATGRSAKTHRWPQRGMNRQMSAPVGPVPPINEHEIVRAMEYLFKTRFDKDRMSRLSKNVKGYFKIRSEFIRVRGAMLGGIAVEAHELAHGIDKWHDLIAGGAANISGLSPTSAIAQLYNSDPALFKEIISELKALDYDPKKKRAFEGWAEWFRTYLTEDEDPKKIAPKFYDFFQKWAAGNGVLEKANKIRDLVRRWRAQGSRARIRGQVREKYPDAPTAIMSPSERAKDITLSKAEWFYMMMKDEAFYIGKASQEAQRRGFKGLTPYELLMAHAMAAPAHAERALFDGVMTVGEGVQEKLSRGLFDYKQHVTDKEYLEWRDYILAVHAREVWDKGVRGVESNPGIDRDDADQLIMEIATDPAKKDRYDKAHEIVTEFNNALTKMLSLIPGQFTEMDWLRVTSKWEKYVPLYRAPKDRNPFIERILGRGSYLNLTSPIFARKPGGSGEPIQDPIISTIQRSVALYRAALAGSVKMQTLNAFVHRQDFRRAGLHGYGSSVEGLNAVEFNVDPKIARKDFPVEKALKQLIDGGFIPEAHGKLLRAAHYFRAGAAGLPSKIILAEHFGLPVPAMPSGLTTKQQQDWPTEWADFSRRHWDKLDTAAQTAIIDGIDDHIDDVPDIMAKIAIYFPKFVAEHGDYIEVMYIDGKPILLRWDPNIYHTLESLDNYSSGIVLTLFRKMNQLKKLGAIGFNTAFAAANFFRDYQAFLHQTKYSRGLGDSVVNPLKWVSVLLVKQALDFLKWIKLIQDNKTRFDPVFFLWKEMSGDLANRLGADRDSAVRIHSRVNNLKPWERVKYAAAVTTDKFRDLISIPEAAFRLAEFERALEHFGYIKKWDDAKKEWRMFDMANNQFSRPDRDTLVRAINAANDVTINFKRRGKVGKKIDAIVTFFNAAMEGQDKQFRTILEAAGRKGAHPLTDAQQRRLATRLLVVSAASVAATIAYWYHRSDDDDYNAQADWLKYGFFTTTNYRGDPTIRIARDHTWNVLPLMTEAMLNDMSGRDKSGKAQVRNAIKNILEKRNPLGSPIDKGMMRFLFGAEIPIIKPSIEVMTNYDMFRQQPIETRDMINREPQDRYNAYTSHTSKVLGRFAKLSPVKIEHWARSATGGLYDQGIRNPAQALKVKKDYTDDVSDFYEAMDELGRKIGSTKFRTGAVPDELKTRQAVMQAYAETMAELREPIRDKTDRDERFEYEKYIIGLARHALDRPPLDRYPNPFEAKDGPAVPVVREILDDWAWTATSPTDSQARSNARAKISAIGASRSQLIPLIMRHGYDDYRQRLKTRKRPLQKVQKPVGRESRLQRLKRLSFLSE